MFTKPPQDPGARKALHLRVALDLKAALAVVPVQVRLNDFLAHKACTFGKRMEC